MQGKNLRWTTFSVAYRELANYLQWRFFFSVECKKFTIYFPNAAHFLVENVNCKWTTDSLNFDWLSSRWSDFLKCTKLRWIFRWRRMGQRAQLKSEINCTEMELGHLLGQPEWIGQRQTQCSQTHEVVQKVHFVGEHINSSMPMQIIFHVMYLTENVNYFIPTPLTLAKGSQSS